MTPGKYDLYLTRVQKFAVALPLIMFTVIPVFFIIAFSLEDFAPKNPHEQLPPFFPWFPALFFVPFIAVFAWFLLSLPYRIIVGQDRQITFKSFLRERVVRATDIISIEPKSIRMNIGISGYQLKHLNGKILYPGQFTGMYLLLAEIKQANPSVDIKGC